MSLKLNMDHQLHTTENNKCDYLVHIIIFVNISWYKRPLHAQYLQAQ